MLHGGWSTSCISIGKYESPSSHYRCISCQILKHSLHVTRNVIPGKLGVDLHLHRVHIPLVTIVNTRCNESMNKCLCGFGVEGSSNTTNLTEPIEARRTYMPETCFSRLRSDDIVTPRRRTWSLALMGPVPRSSDGPLLPRRAGPYLDPAHRSSVLSALTFSLLASIQRCSL